MRESQFEIGVDKKTGIMTASMGLIDRPTANRVVVPLSSLQLNSASDRKIERARVARTRVEIAPCGSNRRVAERGLH